MRIPRVVVLILSYNGKYLLDDSISSYLSNDYGNFLVAVIDNGSNDGTEDYVSSCFPQIELIRIEKNMGYSGGFNAGLECAFSKLGADFVLITNNDVKADSKAIAELVDAAIKDDRIGFATGKVFYYDKPDILQTVGKKEDPIRWNGGQIGNREMDVGQYDQVSERPFADDIFMLVSKKLYEEIGGFDPDFFLQCEEFDWQARAKIAGYKIVFTPRAKIWHKESMTIGKASPLKEFYNARNPMIVILKHRPPEFFRKYFWIHFRKDIVKNSIKMLFRGLKIRKSLKIWCGFFSGICWGFRNRKFTLKHFV